MYTLLVSFHTLMGCSEKPNEYPKDTGSSDTSVEDTSVDTGTTDSGLVDSGTDSGDTADTNDTSDTNTDTNPPPPTYNCGDDTVYEPVPIEDWKVCRTIALRENQPTVSSDAIQLLTSNLSHIETLISADIIAYLKTVRIWLEEDVPAFPGAVYHPSAGWLSNNGYPEYWAEGIQIGNATNYLNWTSIQPAMVLHELSHAWHHQVIGYDQMEIVNAYAAALESGIYDSVEYAGGGMQPAYGMNNKQEYFAELSEAYFWENDFYPFNRSQLETFDPQGFTAIENAWVYPQ